MSDNFTTEITLTVPAGKFCDRKQYSCRFLVPMANHPGYYCFLIPDSYWDNWQSLRKHPQCPSLNQLPKPMKGEGIAVMERLNKFKSLKREEG